MVTAEATKATVVTAAAVAGLFFGFWVQEQAKKRAEARVEKRIADEVKKRRAARDRPKMEDE